MVIAFGIGWPTWGGGPFGGERRYCETATREITIRLQRLGSAGLLNLEMSWFKFSSFVRRSHINLADGLVLDSYLDGYQRIGLG
jgi:hypothetical protein